MKAVLWDMDGTLFEPGGSIRGAINGALESVGLEAFPDKEILVGMPLREILGTRTGDPALIETMVEAFRRISQDEAWRLVSWHDGVRDVVQAVRDAGLATAVVTTKGEGEANHLLRMLGDDGLFDAVVGDDDVRPVKPDPAPVLEACRRLGVRPDEAVMVGDTVFDVHAGKAAGCRTIGVRWGHGDGPHGVHEADIVVADATALREALLA